MLCSFWIGLWWVDAGRIHQSLCVWYHTSQEPKCCLSIELCCLTWGKHFYISWTKTSWVLISILPTTTVLSSIFCNKLISLSYHHDYVYGFSHPTLVPFINNITNSRSSNNNKPSKKTQHSITSSLSRLRILRTQDNVNAIARFGEPYQTRHHWRGIFDATVRRRNFGSERRVCCQACKAGSQKSCKERLKTPCWEKNQMAIRECWNSSFYQRFCNAETSPVSLHVWQIKPMRVMSDHNMPPRKTQLRGPEGIDTVNRDS